MRGGTELFTTERLTMALKDPLAVYNAATNVESHLVKLRLVDAGIEAVVIEDLANVGWAWLGILPGINKPQVWIDRADVERARPILVDYIDETTSDEGPNPPDAASQEPIEVICDKCQAKTIFPARLHGTIQDCPACGEYLDVGELDPNDPYWLEAGEPEEE